MSKTKLDTPRQAFLFTVELRGVGKDKDDAWRDATEAFALDPGETPDDKNIRRD